MSQLGVTFHTTAAAPAAVKPRLPTLPQAATLSAAWSRVTSRLDAAILVAAGIGGWGIAFYLLWLLGKTFEWR